MLHPIRNLVNLSTSTEALALSAIQRLCYNMSQDMEKLSCSDVRMRLFGSTPMNNFQDKLLAFRLVVDPNDRGSTRDTLVKCQEAHSAAEAGISISDNEIAIKVAAEFSAINSSPEAFIEAIRNLFEELISLNSSIASSPIGASALGQQHLGLLNNVCESILQILALPTTEHDTMTSNHLLAEVQGVTQRLTVMSTMPAFVESMQKLDKLYDDELGREDCMVSGGEKKE